MKMKRKTKVSDVKNYVVGHYRYAIYYFSSNKLILRRIVKSLMRNHIKEQIDYRIRVMNRECLDSGSCIKCGCMTTALQMCNKSCEGDCYPPMFSKKKWKNFRDYV